MRAHRCQVTFTAPYAPAFKEHVFRCAYPKGHTGEHGPRLVELPDGRVGHVRDVVRSEQTT